MRDKETGLTDRTLKATRLYIANFLERENTGYTFAQALRDAGYTKRYVHSYCSKLWDNVGVQQLISQRIAELEQKTELTAAKVLEDLAYGVKMAKRYNLLNALARFLELEGRTLAMFKDNILNTDTIKQRELDEKEAAEAVRIAEIRLKQGKAG